MTPMTKLIENDGRSNKSDVRRLSQKAIDCCKAVVRLRIMTQKYARRLLSYGYARESTAV